MGADWRPVSYGAVVAFFSAIVATTGGVMRARWGALAGIVSAAALELGVFDFGTLTYKFPLHFQVPVMLLLASGSLAAAFGAVLSWRSTRSTLGTLRYVLR